VLGIGGPRAARAAIVVAALVASACGAPAVDLERSSAPVRAAGDAAAAALSSTSSTTASTTTTTTPTTPPPTTTAPPAPVRTVVETGFSPFAVAEQLVLAHPAAVVERVGFHQAGHDGARRLEAVATTAAPVVLEDRGRGTDLQTAADIVVPPDAEIRAPVTGTVKRAGSYVLYCDDTDDYAVIEPDARPGWEVKVLHIVGVQVRAGQRVEAGVTVLAPQARPLPFASQVDDHTADPPWPHVHLEVVDPSIPDRPNPGGGSDC